MYFCNYLVCAGIFSDCLKIWVVNCTPPPQKKKKKGGGKNFSEETRAF